MEDSPRKLKSLYRRLVVYHCFREGLAITRAAPHLNELYGKNYISQDALKRSYQSFRSKKFVFADLFELNRLCKLAPPPPLPSSSSSEDEDNEDCDNQNNDEIDSERLANSNNQKSSSINLSDEDSDSSNNSSTSRQGGRTGQLSRKQKRKLILRCFKGNHTYEQACSYLTSLHGESEFSRRTIRHWYDLFKKGDCELKDQPRSGRARIATDDQDDKLLMLIQANPKIGTTKLKEEFGFSRSIISRWLQRLGYDYVIDSWVKVNSHRNEVSDEMLRKYKEDNPQAKVKDVALHFEIPRAIVANRLRKLGFDIPKHAPKVHLPGRCPGRPRLKAKVIEQPPKPTFQRNSRTSRAALLHPESTNSAIAKKSNAPSAPKRVRRKPPKQSVEENSSILPTNSVAIESMTLPSTNSDHIQEEISTNILESHQSLGQSSSSHNPLTTTCNYNTSDSLVQGNNRSFIRAATPNQDISSTVMPTRVTSNDSTIAYTAPLNSVPQQQQVIVLDSNFLSQNSIAVYQPISESFHNDYSVFNSGTSNVDTYPFQIQPNSSFDADFFTLNPLNNL